MRSLRILALVHAQLVPPDNPTEAEILAAPWKMEYDVVVTLRDMGHEVLVVGVGGELGPIREAVEDWHPDIVFNLLEGFDDEPLFDQNVVSYLELLRVPYTGCSPRGLLLTRDKALSKQLLAYHRLPVPEFAVFPLGRPVRRPARLRFPLIVKSASVDASIGISQASVVDSDEKLRERVAFIHRRLMTDAIAEQYIDGRELYVGIVGNRQLHVFPIWELFVDHRPPGSYLIATEHVKWNTRLQRAWGVRTGEAVDLPAELADRIRRLCKRAYRALWVNGYARIDLRLSPEGKVYFLEVNPNPQLAYGEDFAESAERAGLDYEQLLQKILNLGLRWRSVPG